MQHIVVLGSAGGAPALPDNLNENARKRYARPVTPSRRRRRCVPEQKAGQMEVVLREVEECGDDLVEHPLPLGRDQHQHLFVVPSTINIRVSTNCSTKYPYHIFDVAALVLMSAGCSNKELGLALYTESNSKSSQTCLDPDASASVLGIILGGGAGTRLYLLTKKRAKPAVPLGANYRLINIPISNCLNSNISKIYVLTQFNFASLNRHLSTTYGSNIGGYTNEGFIEVLAAQQSPDNPNWFQGTTDAVRQYLWLFEEHNVTDFLILAGDRLYRMDYEKFIQAHREIDADISVAALPMDEKRATAFGLMKIDVEGRIIEFAKKPKGEQLKEMIVDTTILGLDDVRAKAMLYIASMDIYVFSQDVMLQLLREQFPGANDFGSEVIPGATSIGKRVHAYLSDDYWEDIGSINTFYNANLIILHTSVGLLSSATFGWVMDVMCMGSYVFSRSLHGQGSFVSKSVCCCSLMHWTYRLLKRRK
jgi:ADP-glucose pyrophosphorylase